MLVKCEGFWFKPMCQVPSKRKLLLINKFDKTKIMPTLFRHLFTNINLFYKWLDTLVRSNFMSFLSNGLFIGHAYPVVIFIQVTLEMDFLGKR